MSESLVDFLLRKTTRRRELEQQTGKNVYCFAELVIEYDGIHHRGEFITCTNSSGESGTMRYDSAHDLYYDWQVGTILIEE